MSYEDEVLARINATQPEPSEDADRWRPELDGGLSPGHQQASNPGQAARDFLRGRYTIGL